MFEKLFEADALRKVRDLLPSRKPDQPGAEKLGEPHRVDAVIRQEDRLRVDVEKMLKALESTLIGQFSTLLLQTADEITPVRQFVEGASHIVANIDPGNAIVLSEPFPELRTKTLNYQLHMQSFESAPITISIQQQGVSFYINNSGPESVEQLASDIQDLTLEFFKPKPQRPQTDQGTPAA